MITKFFIVVSVATGEVHLLAKQRMERPLHQGEALGNVRRWVDGEVRHGSRQAQGSWGF